MTKARRSGVNVPFVLNVDQEEKHLLMQYVDGPKLKDFLQGGGDVQLLTDVGRCVALLHNDSIIHGDLTTSNILVPKRDGKEILVFTLNSILVFH
jgi:Kae1-associated kinase Bud32